MNDKPKIIVALAVGVVVLTFPFWYAWTGHGGVLPAVEPPAGQTKCIEDKAYMLAHHMEILDQWRQAVVRDGSNELYVSKTTDGKCAMSLTKTCLACHDNRETFCDRCHNAVNVQPSCWDCHYDAKVK